MYLACIILLQLHLGTGAPTHAEAILGLPDATPAGTECNHTADGQHVCPEFSDEVSMMQGGIHVSPVSKLEVAIQNAAEAAVSAQKKQTKSEFDKGLRTSETWPTPPPNPKDYPQKFWHQVDTHGKLKLRAGDKFMEIGEWRFGDFDGEHFSFCHKDGKTALIFTKNGTVHPGPRDDYSLWDRDIQITHSSGIAVGNYYVELGEWRYGVVDDGHFSFAHKDGKTAQIYLSDGTVQPGPRTDYTTWDRPPGPVHGMAIGDRFLEIGNWRIGDVDGANFSISHRDGKTAQVLRKDGTDLEGPRTDYSLWDREVYAVWHHLDHW
mmetsp:Transcript_16360/g.30161  ORF Transcript_16360/g.30161 Transcript_16360/m.30161 type:complete len:321 (+) Transcript_16360:79-1041(+)